MRKPTLTQKMPVLEKTQAICDLMTGDWYQRLGFLQTDGRRGSVIVPGDEANRADALLRRLNKKGAQLPRVPLERKLLLESVIASKAKQIVHQMATTGWQISKNKPLWFTAGNRMIGAPDGAIECAPAQLIAGSRARWFAERGTLDGWETRIASKALYSTCLTVGISAAFAAVLVRASGLQNFTLHLSGESRTGKTTTLLACTSVCGIGHEEKLKNWNSTGAGLLEAAAAFGDIVFPLNEVGAMKGKRENAYHILRDLNMQYAEGGDLERHTSWEAAHGGAAKRFRGICIATAEHSIAEYAALAGQSRDLGELFRAIDVIVIRKGMTTIFDLAPANLDQKQYLQDLHDDLELFHGTPLAPYIEYLIRMGPSKINARVQALMNQFVGRMPAAAHDGVARQMAKNFGLLYAGAILAIEAGVLHWPRLHLQQALKRAFDDAFELCKVVDRLALGLEILKKNLREKIVERKPDSTFGHGDEHAGFWKIEGGGKVIVVHASQFRSWFTGDAQTRRILEWLSSEGHLKQAENATKGVVTQTDLNGPTVRWPNDKMVRSFVFQDPFPDTTSEAAQRPGKSPPRLGGRVPESGTVQPSDRAPKPALEAGAPPKFGGRGIARKSGPAKPPKPLSAAGQASTRRKPPHALTVEERAAAEESKERRPRLVRLRIVVPRQKS
jgi:hypothetical protein